MSRPIPHAKEGFSYLETLTTRWNDNDIYGHMNNVVHYQLFDTAVNGFLIRRKILIPNKSPSVFLVVSSACDYFGEMEFPDTVDAGLRVSHLGDSSVHYEIGLFRNNAHEATAQGRFVHVHVDRQTRKPLPIDENMRHAFEDLLVS